MGRTIYAIGAFGDGNLGDEAIFQGLLAEHPSDSIIQIYGCGLPTHNQSITSEWLNQNGLPVGEDERLLIVGGGGLFWGKEIVHHFYTLSVSALQSGYKVHIEGIGAEYIASDYYNDVRLLCKNASYISVRSTESAKILSRFGAINVVTRKDFAYNLVPNLEEASQYMPIFPNKFPTIGISVTGSNDIEKMKLIVRYLLQKDLNILIIPHVRHQAGPGENDVAAAEQLWSAAGYPEKRLDKLRILPFMPSPYGLLGIYSKLDGVICQRYHSYIFTDMAKKPLFGISTGNRKVYSFLRDNPQYHKHTDLCLPNSELPFALNDWLLEVV